jgi:hypothetical protein
MTKLKGPKREASQVSYLNSSEMAAAIHSKHQLITDAVHKALRNAGLKGLSVHSIRLSFDPALMSGSGCYPPCEPDEDCVLDSNGGQVRWVCVPKLRH